MANNSIEKIKCPFCQKEYSPNRKFWLSLHIQREHSSGVDRVLFYIEVLGFLFGCIGVGLSLWQIFLPSEIEIETKAGVDRIESILLSCSLTGDIDSARNCLASKNITLSDIDQYVELHRNDLDKGYELGIAYMTLGEDDDAIRELTQTLESNPFNRQPYLYLSLLYYNNEEYQKSIDYCMQYLEFVPQDVTCAHTVALANIGLGQKRKAQLTYEVLVPFLENETAQSLANLAVLHYQLGEFEAAANLSYKASVLVPSACNLANTGYYYANICNRLKAEEYYAKAAEVDHDFGKNCFTMENNDIPEELKNNFVKWNNFTLPVELNCPGGVSTVPVPIE